MQQVPQQDEIANEKSLQWLMKRFDVGFRHTTDPQAQVDQPQKLFGGYAGGKQGFAFWAAVESVGRMTPEELFTASLAPGQVPRTWCRCRHKTAEKRKRLLFGLAFLAVAIGWDPSALIAGEPDSKSASVKETIVFIRHGEKPKKEFGQLSCQGLNRALALPEVLVSKFGKPDYVFAPAPSRQTTETGEEYSYVRPLATIEPTAIRLGLPVNSDYTFSDIDGLRFELTRDKYQNARIFVAWEHYELERVVKQIVAQFNGDAGAVPTESGDYDSIYLVQITSDGSAKSVSFTQDHENLDNLSTDCTDARKP